MPFSKRIKLDRNSKMLFYASGHGGNTYMKMQDTHVVYNYDIGIMIKELALKNMYGKTKEIPTEFSFQIP